MSEKEAKVITSPLPGFMELLPNQQILFNAMLDSIRAAYESFGFVPVDTPILERAEVLLAKAGGETEKQIYRFTKGDTDLAMRFDHTVPLARYVVEHQGGLVFPFKRYSIGKVYRGERPQAGRFREFYQCDIDVIGDGSLDFRFDAEIPSVICLVFRKLGFEKFTIRVNNRKIFNGLFRHLDISNQAPGVMQAIDKIEKIGSDAVKEELHRIGLKSETIAAVVNFVSIQGVSSDVISGLRALEISDELFNEGLAELDLVVNLMRQLGIPESNFTVDLSIARGLDYYTGTVYETRLDEYPEIGSVCSGGRYEDLAGYYTSRNFPGVGISIGLTRLFDQLCKREVIRAGSSTKTVVIIIPMTDDMSQSLELATKLRTEGIPSEVSFEIGSKLKKRIGYASKLGIPFAVFVGEDEVKSGMFAVKNLNEGNQSLMSLKELIAEMKGEK